MLWTSIIPIGSMAVIDMGALITVLSLSFLDPASSERHASVDAVFAPWRIFKPLGMTDTRFQDGHTEVVRRRATGYRAAEEGRWRVSMPRSDLAGRSDLMTTAGDLLKWEQNLIDARVGGRALIDWMQTSAKLNNGDETGYGGQPRSFTRLTAPVPSASALAAPSRSRERHPGT